MFSLARLAVRRTQHIHKPSRAAFLSRRARYYSTSSSIPPLPPGQDIATVEEERHDQEDVEEDGVDLDDYYFGSNYPNLMTPDSFMDLRETVVHQPTKQNPYGSRVTVRNDPSMFLAEKNVQQELNRGGLVEDEDEAPNTNEEGYSVLNYLPLTKSEMAALHYYPIFTRRITQQTGKGKIHRMYSLVVVGNGNGLVGYGEGKDDELPRATDKAYAQAVRNMDYVERFEQRTLWTDMDTKFGATRIILRPRPLGFGLRCNPNIHQIMKAAGIKDISAKVWGSRNPLNVIKATFRMLQAGNAPLAMGDGIGGQGRRLDKGSGVRGKGDVERERGRRMVDLRTY